MTMAILNFLFTSMIFRCKITNNLVNFFVMIGEPVPKLQEILEIQDDDGGHLEIIFFTSMIFVVRLPTIW